MKLLAALALILIPTRPLHAQTELSWDAPRGWIRAQDPQTGLVSIAPPGLRPGVLCVVTVFNPEPFAGTASAFHEEIVRRAGSNARQLEAPLTTSVGGFNVTTIHQVMANGLELWVRIYTARWGDRGQAFILTANAPGLAQQFTPTADSMMGRIALPSPADAATPLPVSAPAAAPPGASPASNSLSGLYLTLKATGGFNYGASRDFMVFFPDGRVFWHLPEEGLLDFDAARSQREDANFWGSYQMRGPSFRIRWAGDLEYDGSVNPNGTLVIAGSTYVPETSGPDGRVLSGTYRPSTAGSNPAMDVTFLPDGRFTDRGVRAVVGALDLMYGRYRVPTAGGSGRYRIALNSIVFAYDDGRREQLSFFVPDDDGGPAPRLIVINTFSVVRVSR